MTPAVGPFAIAAALLVVGGASKTVAPGDTANALRGSGIPAGRHLVRLGGAAEAALGVYALLTGSRVAAVLIAVSYLAFAGFVAIALRRRLPIATCGCFGKADTPPSGIHIGLDVAAAGAAVAVALDPGASIGNVVAAQPLAGAPFLVLVVTGVFLSYTALTTLPRVLASVRVAREA